MYLAASSAIGTPEWAPEYLNSWRVGGDHHDWWWTNGTGLGPGTFPYHGGDWMVNSSTRYKIDNLNRANRVTYGGKPLTGPRRGWNDVDFLFTGGQGCGTNMSNLQAHCPMQTDVEYHTSYTMWAIGASPLLIAVDIKNMTAVERRILFNGEVAAMHQDPLGVPGTRVGTDLACKAVNGPEVMGGIPACEIWSKPLHNGSVAVALYNSEPDRVFDCGTVKTTCDDGTVSNCCMVSLRAAAHTITVDFFKHLRIPHGKTVAVHDMWGGRFLGNFKGTFSSAAIQSSGAMLLRMSAVA